VLCNSPEELAPTLEGTLILASWWLSLAFVLSVVTKLQENTN
jgi:hypothetical protein